MPFGRRVPSHDAFSDLFRALDSIGLGDALLNPVSNCEGNIGEAVGADGKALLPSALLLKFLQRLRTLWSQAPTVCSMPAPSFRKCRAALRQAIDTK
ncbi:MAG: hypothetical protein OXI87_21285 [Albidovulum sp.]|nr:hypothetical protein [Albidovulum sp.]MDE0531134.1 hypothetical protein [Albidovulum sp.]